jgi:hypothetical protein
MGELTARTFVVAFLLVYVGLLAALVAWNLRRWLGGRGRKKGLLHHLRHLFRNLPFLHRADKAQ